MGFSFVCQRHYLLTFLLYNHFSHNLSVPQVTWHYKSCLNTYNCGGYSHFNSFKIAIAHVSVDSIICSKPELHQNSFEHLLFSVHSLKMLHWKPHDEMLCRRKWIFYNPRRKVNFMRNALNTWGHASPKTSFFISYWSVIYHWLK
jgi:hypothetical protein